MIPVVLSAVVVAACGRHSTPTNQAMSDDLKRDLDQAASTGLDLASQQKAANYPLTEIPQSSAPSPTPTLRKGAGPKAVRSKHPTVKASPEPTVVAKAEVPETEVTTPAPAPTAEPTPDPTAPAVPRPSPVPTDPNGGEGARGRNGGGSNPGAGDGGGSVLGGIFGVIIRGAIGDGDHCDPRTDVPHRGPRGNHGPYGPVYNGPSTFPRGVPPRLPLASAR